MGSTDHECIRRCLNGHPDDYGRLVRRYQGPLMSYLAGRLGDVERAEEAAQETFVRGYFALGKLNQTGSFFPWLIGIANRVSLEHQRSDRRQQAIPGTAAATADPRRGDDDRHLRRAVASLPPPYAEVITLRYYGGLSCAEVSERLNLPLGTVTKRLSRAYGILREELAESTARSERDEVHP